MFIFSPSHSVRYNITCFSRETDCEETLTALYLKAPNTSSWEQGLSHSRLCVCYRKHPELSRCQPAEQVSLGYHQVAGRTAHNKCWADFHTQGRKSDLEFGNVSFPCLFLCSVSKIITRWHMFNVCQLHFWCNCTWAEWQLEWIWASVFFILRSMRFVTQRLWMHLWLHHLNGAPGPSPQKTVWCQGRYSSSSWLKIKYPYNYTSSCNVTVSLVSTT